MHDDEDVVFVTPSFDISGGNLEIVRLARDLRDRGRSVLLVALWTSGGVSVATEGLPTKVLSSRMFSRSRALRDLPSMALRMRRLVMRRRPRQVVFTHFTTYLWAWTLPLRRRWFFVQGLEWHLGGGPRYRDAVHRLILFWLRRGHVVTTNPYLAAELRSDGVVVAAEVPIWADVDYRGDRNRTRDVAVTLMLRHGAHKRLDLAIALLARLRDLIPDARLAIITPDKALSLQAGSRADEKILAPTRARMRDLYERSRVFVLLSDHEGFGLPPLEAMGSGCVPLVRDCGGPSTYLDGVLADQVLPATADVDVIARRVATLLGDAPRWAELSQAAAERFDRGIALQAQRLDLPCARTFVEASS